MDSYGNFLRRWSLTETGQFECVHDAVDTTLISADDRAAIEARNATLHGVRETVEAYEEALRVPEPDEQHEQPVLDDEGQETGTEPTPAYAAWTAAQAVIAEASDEIKALARIRAGEPEIDEQSGDNLDLAIVLAEWGEEPEITLPSPADVERVRLAALIDRERDRRIAAGFAFAGVFYQARQQDRENIAGASQLATIALTIGGKQPGDLYWHGGEDPFVWIAADNTLTPMDAVTVLSFGQAAASHKHAHIFAARTLKDAETIPPDFTDDAYWP